MKASRMAAVAVGSAAIVGVGYATAPKGLVTLDLAESVDSDASAGEDATTDDGDDVVQAEPTPSVVCEEVAVSADDAIDDDDDDDHDDDDDDHDDDDDDDDDDHDDDFDDGAVQVVEICTTVTPEPTSAATSGTDEAGQADAGSGTFDGPVVTNVRGDFQAQIVVQDGVVVEVNALAAGTSASESQRINAEAIPELAARVLEAQDWDVEAYSGASYTSPGFLESVHGAFDDAGL